MKYTCINIQGNLISEDILKKVEEGTATGQQARDFGLESGGQLRGEIEYAWSKIKLEWKHFNERIQPLPATDPYGTTLARRWMTNFFTTLSFNLTQKRSSLQGDNNQFYNISHTVDTLEELPIHIVGFNEPSSPERNTLDIKTSGGTSRFSPHGTMQEYLNVTEHLYGMVSNGLSLRLMRDSGRLIKLVYIEFDLRRMLEEDKYSEFTLLFRLIHSTRFPKTKQEAEQCPLEKYYQESIEAGNRIRDGLSRAVEESLVSLGNGLLQHEKNSELRKKLQDKSLTPKEFYRQLLRLIYRLLFLMVTEERDLIYDPENQSDVISRKRKIYFEFYSISRIRRLTRLRYLYESQYDDLWQGLMTTLHLFEEDGGGIKLGIQPLAGDLFNPSSIKDLSGSLVNNDLLLQSIRNLTEFEDENRNLVSINYRALDVEELGSVYEGLLELHPVIENIEAANPNQINFLFHEGTERKTTGSYYTRPDLVNELIKSALIPVIKERLKKNAGNKEAQEEALLKIKVCDPAAGSGHMILAAARTIAWELACIRSGESNPAPSVYRVCLREVIQHCVYAVDMNPDAVELCKLSLWLESHNSGKPISFLDHKIRCGNSLVGVTDLSVLKKGIPDNAFNPVTGDDRDICRELKRANASFRKTGQYDLFDSVQADQEVRNLSADYKDLEKIRQDDLETVKQVQKRFEHFRKDNRWLNDWTACNIWTSAFFYTYNQETKQSAPSTERLQIFIQRPAAGYGPTIGKANALSMENRFFHWPLEFPDVFAQGGFDVMLGNPPWEIIELKEQEFFATRDNEIASAENKAARTRLISALENANPEVYKEYLYLSHFYDAERKFLQESGRNNLTAFGRINMYSVFAENYSLLINSKGQAGFIVPTGIATDDSNKTFFGSLIDHNRLISLFDFENREAIFPGVHRSYKFSLLTLAGKNIGQSKSQFGFFLTRVENLQDKMRVFNLSREDFLRLNPNTRTCPVFRTSIDAELTTKIYKNVPVLINETTGINPWGASFKQGLFNMSSDSHLFKTKNQLKLEGFTLWGNKMRRDLEIWLPLYESKMIWHYDHRFGSYAGVENRTSTHTPTPTLEQYQDPNFQILPWYWVEEKNVTDQLVKRDNDGKILWEWKNKWVLGFRDITNSTNERTAIISVEPLNAVGNNNPLLFHGFGALGSLLLVANFSSIVFDFPTRFKIAGTHMNFFYVNQLPILTYDFYPKEWEGEIKKKSFELIYSAWDIKSFADDIWKEADEELRLLLRTQWEENKAKTGGHKWAPPEWCEIDKDGCPMPPFKWDEDRRAVLKAELDAIYARLYGLTTDELRYILDPQDVYGPDFPGETFRVLKEKEIRNYGEYRTKRLVLEAWERMNKQESLPV